MRRTGDICNRAARALLALSCLMCAAACQLRTLELPENITNVRIKLVTTDIRNVTCKIYNPKIHPEYELPEVMHVLFFDRDSEEFTTEAFLSVRNVGEDGSISIEGDMVVNPGTYKMLIYNWGTPMTRIRDIHDWTKAAAYTDPVAPYITQNYSIGSRTPLAEPIVEQPDHLWLVHEENEIIPPHTGIHVIKSEAHTAVDTYYLQVKVDGMENVSEAKAYITGLASGAMMNSGTMISEPTNSVHFSLKGSDDKGIPVLCNVFNTFGHVDEKVNRLEISFNILTRNGNILKKTFDITDLFHTEEAINNHWLLLDEVIEIKPDSGSPGGMQPEVSDWTDEDVNMTI